MNGTLVNSYIYISMIMSFSTLEHWFDRDLVGTPWGKE